MSEYCAQCYNEDCGDVDLVEPHTCPGSVPHTCTPAPNHVCGLADFGQSLTDKCNACTPALADTAEQMFPKSMATLKRMKTKGLPTDTQAMSVEAGHDELCTDDRCRNDCLYWRILEAVRRGGFPQCAECYATQSKNGEWYCETCVVAGLEEVGGHD